MLVELKANEWAKIFHVIPSAPENLLIKSSMLIQMKGHPSTKCRYFATGDLSSTNTFLLVLKTEEHTQKTWNSISVNSPSNSPIDDAAMNKILYEFNALAGAPFEIPNQFGSGFQRDAEKLAKWSHKNFRHNYEFFGAYLYYANTEELKNGTAPALHSDYYFDRPQVDIDAIKVLENYPHSYPQTPKSISNRLTHLPSVFVRHTATGQLAGYMMVDEFGSVTLQFTYPPHRGHGIAQSMEFRLVEKCVRFGLETPFKMIEKHNDRLIQNHTASRLWKCCTDAEGIPKDFVFFVSKNRQ